MAKLIKNRNKQNGRVREVEKSVYRTWSDRFESGDIGKIRKATRISEKTLREAINLGIASPETESAITKFFASKKQVA